MSSWSSYPPPPRRSRSRSPSRGGYPPGRPYPDSYPDGYRDWEYDRERWPYERDRLYDYGRRGRSRSPPVDETGRKRRRSMSPYDRERYDPRPRYNDDYDTHSRYGYSTSPRRYPGGYPPSRRAPPDPRTFEFPATLKQYAEWFRYTFPDQATEEDAADKAAEQEAGDGSKPRNGIKTKWEKYKKEFAATQLQTMFDHHRKSPWFSEKYDPAPDFENLRMRVRKEGWKGRLDTFLHDLELGKFDQDFNESETVPSSPAKDTSETANIDGSGAAGDDPKPAFDDMQDNVEGDDDEPARADANGKGSYDKRNINRGEEMSVLPEGNQVMIRTIPPDIGRVKLEEFLSKISGFKYVALGDPLQKRNYYRAGWIRFQEDSDMSAVLAELSEKKLEGFKLHVTHNTRPFTTKIRFAPEVASRPERLEKDLENAKVLASTLEEQAATLRVFKPAAPSSEKANGDAQVSSESNGDATMNSPEDDEPDPKERGVDAVEKRIEKVMADMRDQALIDVNDEKAYHAKKVVVSLDLYLAYLRASFHTCYYCAVVTDHLEELQRKCVKHVRKSLSKTMIDEIKAAEAEKENFRRDDESKPIGEGDTEEKNKSKDKDGKKVDGRDWKRNDERWLESLDMKIAVLINRDGVDPRDYGGKSYDEELTKAVEPYVKQEDEGKFRCKTCQKLFKATSFVEKHIANKHPDLVKQLDDLSYFNNFALDPHRIQPFAHPPPPATGNSTQLPPQAFGIQAPSFHGGDYGRGAYYGPLAPYPPGFPPYHNGYWDGGHPGGHPGSYPSPASSRRDEGGSGRRLSERISTFASNDGSSLPTGVGLPPKPRPAALDSALTSGNGTKRPNRSGSQSMSAVPPPPPDAKEDPRAAAGKRVSYHDMDLVAEGDVELMY